eukprot:6490070-Amphidinium_carterae.2
MSLTGMTFWYTIVSSSRGNCLAVSSIAKNSLLLSSSMSWSTNGWPRSNSGNRCEPVNLYASVYFVEVVDCHNDRPVFVVSLFYPVDVYYVSSMADLILELMHVRVKSLLPRGYRRSWNWRLSSGAAGLCGRGCGCGCLVLTRRTGWLRDQVWFVAGDFERDQSRFVRDTHVE